MDGPRIHRLISCVTGTATGWIRMRGLDNAKNTLIKYGTSWMSWLREETKERAQERKWDGRKDEMHRWPGTMKGRIDSDGHGEWVGWLIVLWHPKSKSMDQEGITVHRECHLRLFFFYSTSWMLLNDTQWLSLSLVLGRRNGYLMWNKWVTLSACRLADKENNISSPLPARINLQEVIELQLLPIRILSPICNKIRSICRRAGSCPIEFTTSFVFSSPT